MKAGVHGRVLDEAETRVVLRLLTRALEARTVVAGRLRSASGGNESMTIRLVPEPGGSTVRTVHGVLHLPGLRLDLEPAAHTAGALRERARAAARGPLAGDRGEHPRADGALR